MQFSNLNTVVVESSADEVASSTARPQLEEMRGLTGQQVMADKRLVRPLIGRNGQPMEGSMEAGFIARCAMGIRLPSGEVKPISAEFTRSTLLTDLRYTRSTLGAKLSLQILRKVIAEQSFSPVGLEWLIRSTAGTVATSLPERAPVAKADWDVDSVDLDDLVPTAAVADEAEAESSSSALKFYAKNSAGEYEEVGFTSLTQVQLARLTTLVMDYDVVAFTVPTKLTSAWLEG